jgi:hypothetical protein
MSLCAGKPEAYFVVPDPYTPEVASVSSQAGIYPGLTTSTTPGRLVPMQSGESLDAGVADAYDYRIVRAGGTNTAEFVYGLAGGAFNGYFGKDDIRNWWGTHCPISVSPFVRNNSVMWHAPSRRLFVCGGALSSTTIAMHYRNVDTDRFDSFTSAYSITLRQALHSSDSAGVGMVSLYDGSCIMVVRNTTATDFDVYRSMDPTTNDWTLISRDILLRFIGTTVTQGTRLQIRVAASGDYVRLVFLEPTASVSIDGVLRTASVARTLVSQDRGATWSESVSSSTLYIIGFSGFTDDNIPFDICGIGETGAFAIGVTSYIPPAITAYLTTGIAYGAGAWTFDNTQRKACAQIIRQVVMVANESSVYAYALWSDLTTAANDGWMLGKTSVPAIASADPSWQWQAATSMNGYDGMDLLPGRVKAVWCGNGWYFYGCTRTEAAGTVQTNGFAWYAGTWTKRSLGAFGPSQNPTAFSNTMWDLTWAHNYGKPSDGAGTAWTRTTSGTGTDSLTAPGLSITSTSSPGSCYYQHAETTAGTWYTSGGVWSFMVRLNTGDGTSAVHAMNVRMADAAGGYYYQMQIRFQATAISITDGWLGSVLGGITGLTIDTGSTGAFHLIRVSVAGGGASLHVEVQDTSTGTWYTSNTFNLTRSTLGAGFTSFVQWGILSQSVATSEQSWWRDFACTMDGTLLNRQAANMTDAGSSDAVNLLFGAVCQPAPQYLEYGLYLSWSGLYGTENDNWTGTMAYTFPGESVLVDSPRIAWHTEDVSATGTIVLYVGTSTTHRFSHDAIALFGCNNRYALVDYDDNVGFTSPTAAETVDFTAYGSGATPLSVASRSGNSLFVSGSSFKWTTGELVGFYVRMLTGSAAGLTFKVTRHPAADTLIFDGESTSLGTQGVNVGNTFCIFAPYAVKKYSVFQGLNPYMRIRLADTDTAEGYHQLGTVVAGRALNVDVPLDWAHTDDDQPNVTSYRTKSGIAWAFAEGPTQRTYTGRVVGDAERWREKFRNMFRQISYEGKACALVLNADQTPESLMLGRVKSGASLDNAGWYRDSNGIMRTAGDLSLTFVEEK